LITCQPLQCIPLLLREFGVVIGCLIVVISVCVKTTLFIFWGSMGQRQDSLKQLTELVHKGEKKGLFSNKMPARIQQVVREENLLFMRNRNVYDADYFTFVRDLCSRNMV